MTEIDSVTASKTLQFDHRITGVQRAGTTVITKHFGFDSAHFLPNVPEDHKCRRMHGHSYHVWIHVTGEVRQREGWIVVRNDTSRAITTISIEPCGGPTPGPNRLGTPVAPGASESFLLRFGCYDVAEERGMRVPDDVSVVGYNDIPFSDKFSPPLTTVRIPLYQIGRRAAQLLLGLMRGQDATPASLKLAPELVVRRSTAPVA
jgi:hypothetical protein